MVRGGSLEWPFWWELGVTWWDGRVGWRYRVEKVSSGGVA